MYDTLETNRCIHMKSISSRLQASFPGKCDPRRPKDIIRFLIPIFGNVCALMIGVCVCVCALWLMPLKLINYPGRDIEDCLADENTLQINAKWMVFSWSFDTLWLIFMHILELILMIITAWSYLQTPKGRAVSFFVNLIKSSLVFDNMMPN